MKQKNTNKNINVGNTFNGPTQMVGSVVINFPHEDLVEEPATYKTEPLWRSPFTLAVLSWISVIIGVLGIVPIGNIMGVHFLFSMILFKGKQQKNFNCGHGYFL